MSKNTRKAKCNENINSNIEPKIQHRMQLVRETFCLSQTEFAKKLGYSKGHMNDIETGRKFPGRIFLTKLNQIFNIDLNWLLTGKGQMIFDYQSASNPVYDFGQYDKEIRKILEICELSPLFLLSLITYAQSYFWQFEQTIKKDIKRNKQLEGKEDKPNSISLNLDNFSPFSQEDE